MSAKSTPTKGAWVAVGGMVEHQNDRVADICSCYPSSFGQGHLERGDGEIRANARLIAAAPALLEALQGLLTALSAAKTGDIGAANWMNGAEAKAIASIALATGKRP